MANMVVASHGVDNDDRFAHVTGDTSRIWFRVIGPEWGGRILMVPSLDTTHMWYSRQVYELEKDRQVVLMDFVGRGKSDPARKGTKHDEAYYASQIKAVALEAFGSEKKMFGIVAHGTGAIPAMKLYEDNPFMVKWMVLLSPYGLTPRSVMVPIGRCLCCLLLCCFANCCHRRRQRKKYSPENFRKRWEKHFVEVSRSKEANKEIFTHSNQQLAPESEFANQVRKSHRDMNVHAPAFFKEALHRVSRKRKVFVAWGAEDGILSAREMLRFGDVVPDDTSSELFRNGGHAFHVERALAFNRALRMFIQKHDKVTKPPETIVEKGTATATKILQDAWDTLTGTESEEDDGYDVNKSFAENIWDSITSMTSTTHYSDEESTAVSYINKSFGNRSKKSRGAHNSIHSSYGNKKR